MQRSLLRACDALRLPWFSLVWLVVSSHAGFLLTGGVTAAEPVVCRPACAPAPADNALKGFVPYAGQGRQFPHSLEFNYLSLASLMTGRKEDEWFYFAAMRKAGPAAMERWKTAPIGGEIRPELWPCLWKTEGCTKGQDFARCVRQTHVTWLMDTSTSSPLAPDERERALAAARSLGYELQVVQATAALKGRALELSVTLTNRGVAPFYAGWPVRVVAVGADGGEVVAELPFVLKTLLPATSDSRSVTLDLKKVSSGEVTLFLGVPNPLKGGRSLRFANADPEPLRPGWLTLGKIVLP